MSEQTKTKRGKLRRRPRQSSFHFTVWTMNGEPFPEEVIEQLESTFQTIADDAEVRLLHDIRKF